ncbi:hypothetical protein V8C34DRAFT_268239 [Trichoderma compactum]
MDHLTCLLHCNASMPLNTSTAGPTSPCMPLQRAAKCHHLTSPKNTRTNPLALRSPHESIPAFPVPFHPISPQYTRHIHVLKRSAPVSATRLAYGTLCRNIVTPRLCSVHVCDNACQRNSCH